MFAESGRGLGHVTPTILAVRSAILATAWLLVKGSFSQQKNYKWNQNARYLCNFWKTLHKTLVFANSTQKLSSCTTASVYCLSSVVS